MTEKEIKDLTKVIAAVVNDAVEIETDGRSDCLPEGSAAAYNAGVRHGARWVVEAIARHVVHGDPNRSFVEFVEACGIKL